MNRYKRFNELPHDTFFELLWPLSQPLGCRQLW